MRGCWCLYARACHGVHGDHRGQSLRDPWTSGLAGRAFTHQVISLTCKICFVSILRRGLTMSAWLVWNSFHRPSWPWTHRDPSVRSSASQVLKHYAPPPVSILMLPGTSPSSVHSSNIVSGMLSRPLRSFLPYLTPGGTRELHKHS